MSRNKRPGSTPGNSCLATCLLLRALASIVLATSYTTSHAGYRVLDSLVNLVPGTHWQWIAQDLVINGVPTSVRHLTIDASFPSVLTRFRSSWQSQGSIVERKQGRWHVLATKEADKFISLQLKARGKQTEGILTITSDPLEHNSGYEGELPLPDDLSVISWQSHRDGPFDAQTVTLASPRPVDYVRDSVVSAFNMKGWRLEMEKAATTLRDGRVLHLTGDVGKARIIIGRDKRWSDQTLALIVFNKS